MNAKVFLDTCVLTYAFVSGDARQKRALELLVEGGSISVQVLNELANTCCRKLRFDWDATVDAVTSVKACCLDPFPLSIATHEMGMRLARCYNFSVYDGLILASALEAGCAILYSEDMQHGQVVEGLRIVNPFLMPQ